MNERADNLIVFRQPREHRGAQIPVHRVVVPVVRGCAGAAAGGADGDKRNTRFHQSPRGEHFLPVTVAVFFSQLRGFLRQIERGLGFAGGENLHGLPVPFVRGFHHARRIDLPPQQLMAGLFGYGLPDSPCVPRRLWRDGAFNHPGKRGGLCERFELRGRFVRVEKGKNFRRGAMYSNRRIGPSQAVARGMDQCIVHGAMNVG